MDEKCEEIAHSVRLCWRLSHAWPNIDRYVVYKLVFDVYARYNSNFQIPTAINGHNSSVIFIENVHFSDFSVSFSCF